jgi:hypothetical protein
LSTTALSYHLRYVPDTIHAADQQDLIQYVHNVCEIIGGYVANAPPNLGSKRQ